MPKAEWRHHRERLLLPVVVMPGMASDNPFESVRVEGLFDTGATGTGIRADIARRLDLRQKGERRVYTANGDVIRPEYVVRVGFICGDYSDPGFEPNREQPFVLDREILGFGLAEQFSYPVLIGMDIIGQGDLVIQRSGLASFSIG